MFLTERRKSMKSKKLLILLSLSFLFSQAVLAEVVDKIIDGETIRLNNGEEVRIIGVQTKSYGASTDWQRDFERADFFAKKFIHSMLYGKTVFLAHDKKHKKKKHRDKRGRLLAYVWYTTFNTSSITNYLDKDQTENFKLLNNQLIRNGYAYVDTSEKLEMTDRFKNSEKHAQKNKLGVWGQTKIYDQSSLKQAQNARAVFLSRGVHPDLQLSSLEKARKFYAKLMKLVIEDYQLHYERSWLGLAPNVHEITAENKNDINEALRLSPNNPKCYIQKHFILRLEGKHHEAVEAYEKGVLAAARLGMVSRVTYEVNESLGSQGYFDAEIDTVLDGWKRDALRAKLNEDHFLVYMARHKSALGTSEERYAKDTYDEISKDPTFQLFSTKHKNLIARTQPEDILYETGWSTKGYLDPEEVIMSMEKKSA